MVGTDATGRRGHGPGNGPREGSDTPASRSATSKITICRWGIKVQA